MFYYLKSKNNIIKNKVLIKQQYSLYKFKKELKNTIRDFLNKKSLVYDDIYDFIQYVKIYDDISVDTKEGTIYCNIKYRNNSNVELYDKILFDQMYILDNKKNSVNISINRLNILEVTWNYDNTRVSFTIPPSPGFIEEYEKVSLFVKKSMVKIFLYKENIKIKDIY